VIASVSSFDLDSLRFVNFLCSFVPSLSLFSFSSFLPLSLKDKTMDKKKLFEWSAPAPVKGDINYFEAKQKKPTVSVASRYKGAIFEFLHISSSIDFL
jgi:hypothetical protein